METSNGPKSVASLLPCIKSQVNWHKSMAIWASPFTKQTTLGGKKVQVEEVQYLGILVGHHLSTQANFDKLMRTIKGKLINWTASRLSIAKWVLVVNQVFLATMWYTTTCWNPTFTMSAQPKALVHNFIWKGRKGQGLRSNGPQSHCQLPKEDLES